MLKLQSAVEFLTTYGWAFLIVAVVLIVVYLITTYQAPTQYLYSSCTISPQLNCFEPIIESNSVGSTFILILSNQFGRIITFPPNAISVQPSITSNSFVGQCYPTYAPQGATIYCSIYMIGYKQSTGSTISPTFTISYYICDPKCTSTYSTTGFSTLTVINYQNVLFYTKLLSNSIGRGYIVFQGTAYTSGNTVATVNGLKYQISASPNFGYSFSSWSVSANIVIANSLQQSTQITSVSGNGTITANFN